MQSCQELSTAVFVTFLNLGLANNFFTINYTKKLQFYTIVVSRPSFEFDSYTTYQQLQCRISLS